MKKLQAFFAVLSVVAGISGAFAFTPKTADPCASVSQFYAFNPNTQKWVEVPLDRDDCLKTTGPCFYYNAGTPANPVYVACAPNIYGFGPHIV